MVAATLHSLTRRNVVDLTKETFWAKRSFFRFWFYICFFGGLAMLVVDWSMPFPTPVRGAYTTWWLIPIGLGVWCYIKANRLPIFETLMIAERENGELTVTELTTTLGIDGEDAERTLIALEDKSYSKSEKRGDAVVWIFPDIVANRKPIEDVLLLAGKNEGVLTVTDLVGNPLNLTAAEAEETLAFAVAQGYAQLEQSDGKKTWIFPDSKEG